MSPMARRDRRRRHDGRIPNRRRRRARRDTDGRGVDQARGRHPVIAGKGQRDRRGLAHRIREKGRRSKRSVGRAVLQQADAGRPVSALSRDRQSRRPAAHRLQRPEPDRHRSRQRDRAAPRADTRHRRNQGSDCRPRPGQRAPQGAAFGTTGRLRGLQRRRLTSLPSC